MSVTVELRIITMGVTTRMAILTKTEVLYKEDSILTDIVSSSVENLSLEVIPAHGSQCGRH